MVLLIMSNQKSAHFSFRPGYGKKILRAQFVEFSPQELNDKANKKDSADFLHPDRSSCSLAHHQNA